MALGAERRLDLERARQHGLGLGVSTSSQQGAPVQIERRSQHRVRRTEQALEDLRRALGAGDRFRRIALREPHFRETDESPRSPLVLGAEAAFPDLEGAPHQRSQLVAAAEHAQHLGQVPHRQADIGIVGIEPLLLNSRARA